MGHIRSLFCLFFLILTALAGPAAAEDAVVRFTITNHGQDVGDRGKYFLFPVGERKKDLGYGYSGAEAKVPEGTYDILLRYRDGGVRKEIWREKKALAGVVEETVEMDVKLAQVKYALTNNGVMLGSKGRFLIFPAGSTKDDLVDEPSGSSAIVAAGVYDVLLKFRDGSVKKELWLKNQKLEGLVEKTIEVSVNLAEAVIHVTRLGQPSKIAWCGLYPPGQRDEPVAKGYGEETLAVAEGTYDIGCFYSDAGISTEQWLKNQAVKGRAEFKFAFDFTRTSLKVTPPSGSPAGIGGSVAVYLPGDRKRPIAKGGLGERLLMAGGTYDIVMKYGQNQASWTRVGLEGEVVVPFASSPPAKSLKNVTILSTEPESLPVQTAPAAPAPETVPMPVQPPASLKQPEPKPAPFEPEPVPVTIPAGPEVVVTSEGPPPQTLPPWAAKPAKKRFGGCVLLVNAPQALAADAVVSYTITNGGVDTGNKAWFGVYPVGERDGDRYKAYAHSKGSVTVPAGTYDVGIHFQDGSAKKVIWEPNVSLTGTVQKTMELNFPLAKVSYTITNGGIDTGNKAWFGVYPVGERDGDRYLGYAHSKGSVTVPAGTYDIGIHFQDGSAKKEIWETGIALAGNVEKTTDLGLGVAKVSYTITNGGIDTGNKAWFGVYPVGERDGDRYLGYAHSKGSVTAPAGTYDVGIHFADGSAKKDMWQANVKIEGNLEQTVEIGVPVASVKYLITNGGVDAGPKAWFGIYAAGDRESANTIAYASSNTALTVAEGTYDVGIHFQDGNVIIKKWLPNLVLKGKVEQAVEIGAAMADLTVHVTRGGQPLKAAWCGVFPDGEKGDYSAYAHSDQPMRTLEGTYDVGCFYSEGGLSASKWLKQQTIKGKVELAMELDLKPASLTVTAPAAGTAGGSPAAGASAAKEPNIDIILDASGSMIAKVGEKTRMDVAKDVLGVVVQSLPETGVNVALRVYGTAPKADKNCRDSKLMVARGPVNKQALKAAIDSVTLNGYTPIAYNLEQAAADLPMGGNNALVLVTDGIESCGGDPCAVASKLASQGVTSRSFVVGFGVGADKGRFLECIGKYYPASSPADLQKALSEILAESLKPVTGTVTVASAGARDRVAAKGSLGDKLVFPAGTYDVSISAGGKDIVWPSVELAGDVVVPLSESPPAKKIDNLTVLAPEPGHPPVRQEAQPASPAAQPSAAKNEPGKKGLFGCGLVRP